MLSGPFLGTEALAAGTVTEYQLRTRYRAVVRNVYLAHGEPLTPENKAAAAWLWSRRRATVAGVSAAALHGARWLDADLPAELNRPSRDKAAGITLSSAVLADDETCRLAGMPVTTPARTAFDIGRRGPRITAAIRLDALMHATGLVAADVTPLLERHRGVRGVVALRALLPLADGGAESPPETRLRLLLVDSGLPVPATQVEVFDRFGGFVARIDLAWPRWRVGVEYDGVQHWTDARQRTRDIDRIAELETLSWRIVRVGADLLRHRRRVIVARALAALRAAGCPV